MAIYSDEIIGRIAKKVDAIRTDAARPYTIAKILKYQHLELPIVMPNIVREYKTSVSDALSITGSTPVSGTKVGVVGEVDISTVLVGGTTKELIEVHSVVADSLLAPYKRVMGLEHISNLNVSDESGGFGRYWWLARGGATIYVYRGAEISDSNVKIGFTSGFDTSYADIANINSLDSVLFDCPLEAINYLIIQTAAKVLEDYRMQIPEWMGQEIQDQRQALQAADQNVAAQLAAMEKRGADSTR